MHEKNNMNNCKFCHIIEQNKLNKHEEPATPLFYNNVIMETDHFIVLPVLGAIIEGYLMIITKKHCNSMAECSVEELIELEELISLLNNVAKKEYGVPFSIFEHGTHPSNSTNISQSSIFHAHIHLVPFFFTNQDDIIEEAKMDSCDGIRYLNSFIGNSYVFFRNNSMDSFITLNSTLPSQYMRRKLANAVGLDSKWNWRECSFFENITSTITAYKRALSNMSKEIT